MRASILLATCNRCEKLRILLDTLKNDPSIELADTEVLVIDNNSTDATRRVVAEYASLKKPVFRYLLEKKPGKSRALNAGIREAKGEILAFTDDDCIPAPGWLQTVLKEFDADPSLAVLGGRVELFDDEDVRQTILLSRERAVVTKVAELCPKPSIIGANMAFRRRVFGRGHCFEFDPWLGPGSRCRAAEDMDILYRTLKGRCKVAYMPNVLMFHNHGRKSQHDERLMSYSYALGRGGLYCKHILRADFGILATAYKEIFDLSKTLAKGLLVGRDFPHHKVAFTGIFLGAYYYCRAFFAGKFRLRTNKG